MASTNGQRISECLLDANELVVDGVAAMTVQTDRRLEWGFWLKWVFINAVAFTVAYTLANDIANIVFQLLYSMHVMYVSFEVSSTNVFAAMVFGAIYGILIGAVQSLALHGRFRQATQWAIATGLGESLAVGLNNFGAMTAMTAFPIFVPGVVIGIFVGIAQWVILRRKFSNSEWWILASAISFGVIIVASFWLGSHPTEAIARCLNGIIFGAITGLVLVYLYNHPKQPVPSAASATQVN